MSIFATVLLFISFSGFTLARANPIMKGNLIYKKTQYFCFLGQNTLYYAAGETDETPKGEFSV